MSRYSEVVQAEVETEQVEHEGYTEFRSQLVNADTGQHISHREIYERFRELRIVGVHLKPVGRSAMNKMESEGYPGFAKLVGVIQSDDEDEEDIAVINGGGGKIQIPESEFFELYQLD